MYSLIVKWRSAVLVFLTHKMALPFLKLIRKPEIFPYDKKQLYMMEEGTLGRELVEFIDQKELELLPYYARHDIKHILLEYDTTDEGEACLQCFMLGNGHVSFPVVATVIYGFCTMPEYWKKFNAAYKRGQRANKISDWDWFGIIPLRVKYLKTKIHQLSLTI